MQFLVTGMDGVDGEAPARRLSAREAHLTLGERMKASGNLLFAAAILDEGGKMIGSSIVCDFPSAADLDNWLKEEPYVTDGVWQQIEVRPCRVSPSFATTQARA